MHHGVGCARIVLPIESTETIFDVVELDLGAAEVRSIAIVKYCLKLLLLLSEAHIIVR